MDKREAELERARLNKVLADLWGQFGKVKTQMMEITKQGMEGNWTRERYDKERGPLNDQRAKLATEIQERMAELKVVDTTLGLR